MADTDLTLSQHLAEHLDDIADDIHDCQVVVAELSVDCERQIHQSTLLLVYAQLRRLNARVGDISDQVRGIKLPA